VYIEHEESVHTALKCSETKRWRNCILTFNTYDGNLQKSKGNIRNLFKLFEIRKTTTEFFISMGSRSSNTKRFGWNIYASVLHVTMW